MVSGMDTNFGVALGYLKLDEASKERDLDLVRPKMPHGISLVQYHVWKKNSLATRETLGGLDPAEIEAFYREVYWLPVGGSHLPSGMDYFLFDLSHRFSSARVLRWFHRTIGREHYILPSPVDSEVCERVGVRDCIYQLDRLSRQSLRSTREWEMYCTVWTNRANRVRARALKMSGVSVLA